MSPRLRPFASRRSPRSRIIAASFSSSPITAVRVVRASVSPPPRSGAQPFPQRATRSSTTLAFPPSHSRGYGFDTGRGLMI